MGQCFSTEVPWTRIACVEPPPGSGAGCETDGRQSDDAGARERLAVASGMIVAFEPWTLLLEIVFETTLHLDGGKVSIVSPAFTNLSSFGQPRIDGPYLQLIAT